MLTVNREKKVEVEMIESPPDWSKDSDDTPYGELDESVVGLCRALNGLPGIWTVGSCGGHEGGGQDAEGRNLPAGEQPADQWRVTIRPELEGWRPTSSAWLSLEFVAWLIYDVSKVRDVEFQGSARPPYLNDPAHMLMFQIHGWRDGERGISSEEVAGALQRMDRQFYRPES
jgi:hypothetical protein